MSPDNQRKCQRTHEHQLGRTAIALALLALLGACATPDAPLVPAPLKTSRATPDSVQQEDTRSSELRVQPLPTAPGTAPSAAARQNAALDAETGPKVLDTELARVNLEQVTLGTFAQLVFGDVLKKNVSVDPQVMSRKELVSFRSGLGQTAAQLENSAKLLLKSHGINAMDIGGLVRVQPDSAAPAVNPEIRRSTAVDDTPVPLRPVYQLVELRAVRNTEVASWLRTMFGDRLKSQEDAGRNAIMISGTPDVLGAAMEAIRVLDQPALVGVKSLALSPAYWSADELARRLYDVLSAQGYAVQALNQPLGNAGRAPIILMPISALNTVYVFARGDDVLGHITEWARTLDRPSERGVGKNFFTYAVKHKDASALAQTLEQLLTGARPAATGGAQGAAQSSSAGKTTSVVVDKSTNMLIFQASQEDYPQIVALLQNLDRPTRSALIEVSVAELTLDNDQETGVGWLATHGMKNGASIVGGTLGNLSVGTAGGTFRVFDTIGQVRAVLNALVSEGKGRLLSSPRLMARNGEQAQIQVGDEVPIITSQLNTGVASTNTTTPQNQVLQTVQYRKTGVLLKIKPVIHSGELIDLDVMQEVSAARSTQTGVNVSPTFGTRSIETKLTLRNGGTVLLGGLISEDSNDTNAGLPLLKDIPVLGHLFKVDTKKTKRTELVVLITPYVLNDQTEAEALSQAFRNTLGSWAQNVGGMPSGQGGAGAAVPLATSPSGLPATSAANAPVTSPAQAPADAGKAAVPASAASAPGKSGPQP